MATAAELYHLAAVFSREAARIDAVRDELHRIVADSKGEWEGLVAERFRAHTGAGHRQQHLEAARDRLQHVAHLARLAAQERAK